MNSVSSGGYRPTFLRRCLKEYGIDDVYFFIEVKNPLLRDTPEHQLIVEVILLAIYDLLNYEKTIKRYISKIKKKQIKNAIPEMFVLKTAMNEFNEVKNFFEIMSGTWVEQIYNLIGYKHQYKPLLQCTRCLGFVITRTEHDGTETKLLCCDCQDDKPILSSRYTWNNGVIKLYGKQKVKTKKKKKKRKTTHKIALQ